MTRIPEPQGRAPSVEVERRNVRTFLYTHAALGGLGLLSAVSETVFDLQPSPRRLAFSWGVALAFLFVTGVGALVYRSRRGLDRLVPAMLVFDSVVVIGQLFQEGDFETAWMGTPLMLLFMLPIFTNRPRMVWWIAATQVTLVGLLLYLRLAGYLPYELRSADMVHDADFALFSWIGFVIAVVGASIMSGSASKGLIQSNALLNAELHNRTRQLREAQARIVEHEKVAAGAMLTAGVAHEIFNPLTFVRTNLVSLQSDISDLVGLVEAYGAADRLLKKNAATIWTGVEAARARLCLDDPRATLLELVTDTAEGVERVQAIVRDLQTFTRLDEAERKVVDPLEGIHSALKILGAHFATRRVTLEKDLSPAPDIEVYAAQYNQLVMNLLQNAVAAAPEETGVVWVKTWRADDGLCVEISDNGPGVPEDLREQIFEPFFTTKGEGRGTGLGLAIARCVAQRHGGHLTLSDRPGGGARFQFWLPYTSATPVEAAPPG